jgi:two-component system sensor histidine kinase CpxA
MKVRYPLYLQTLAMLMLYLGTLLGITLLCFNAQFGIGWETALKGPLGERFESIAGGISSQLHSSRPKRWPEILQSFEDIYHVKFYIFDRDGNELAGKSVELPPKIEAMLTAPPPPPEFGPGAPGPRMHGPGGSPDRFFDGPPEPFGHGPAFAPGPHFGPGAFEPNAGPLLGPGPFNTNSGPHFPAPPDEFFGKAHHRFLIHTNNPDRFWIGAHIFVYSPQMQHAGPGVLVATCDNLWQSNLLFDFQFVSTLLASILIFSLLFWWPFVYRITSTLTRLTKATESIAQGKFDTRVKTGGIDEIARLSEAVDTMAEHLEGYVQEQKRLLADISHELFSPLARLQMALELLESSSDKDQSGHINDIREEVEEMNELITELIAYSKAGMQAKTRELVSINLKETIESLVPKFASGINVTINIPAEVNVMADQLLLDRAIGNVLRNSVRYAGPEGKIVTSTIITTDANSNTVTLSISDDGPGVSEEALKYMGQPFYRPEASRNRASGGFGLGLTIVKSCVEACGGKLSLLNNKPHGLIVELVLQREKAKKLGL